MENNIKDKTIQFSNKNANKTEFDLKNKKQSNKKLSLDKTWPKTKKTVFL